jgi:hypothetical protein
LTIHKRLDGETHLTCPNNPPLCWTVDMDF